MCVLTAVHVPALAVAVLVAITEDGTVGATVFVGIGAYANTTAPDAALTYAPVQVAGTRF